MTVDSLKVSKLGKIVVKLVKEPPSSGELIFISPRRRPTRPGASPFVIAPVELEMNCHPFRINATDAERHVLQYMYLTSFSILRYLSQNAAIKDMASNVERKWRTLVSSAEGPVKPETNAIEGQSRQPVSLDVMTPDLSLLTTDPKTKKRKLSDVPIAKGVPPAKRSALGVPSSAKPVSVKKEPTRPAAPTVKDAKSDSSFFSAPKPKPKLPSFKKAPPAPSSQASKQQTTNNVAQPSSIDPFQELLKSMAKGRKESPAASTPPSTSTPVPQAPLVMNGKKKKTVTWPSDDKLESVRLIEKAVYDDDPVDVSFLSPFLDLYDTLMTCSRSQFCGCFSLYRVYMCLTACAIWIGGKELLCMRIYLKKPLTGLNLYVSK